MPEIIFLTLAEVVQIHNDQINLYGGHKDIQNIELLESAIAMPEASFAGELLHPDIFTMAAAYAFHLCQNHPFVDGNKRVALACALVFLEINGISLLDPKGLLYEAMINVASGNMSKKDLAETFRGLPREM